MATTHGRERRKATSSRWGLAGSALAIHAVLGALLFGAPTLLKTSAPPNMNPETAFVLASGGAFLLGVLLVLAFALAHRLAHRPDEGGWGLAFGLGLAGPLTYGLAGSGVWGLVSLFADGAEPVLVLFPAMYAGVAAPFVALVCVATYLFLRET